MSMRRVAVVAGLACGLMSGVATAATITKSPDLGSYWAPLSSTGSYVYADSFVAPTSGKVTDLGVWLLGGSSEFRLEVLSGASGGGPDGASVLAQTSVHSESFGSLTYADYTPVTSGVLTAGETYWFAASTVGLGGNGSYVFGGHTQNSQQQDNGTFWYSNDPSGLNFDGREVNPEIAFSVTLSAVPLPASAPMFGAALLGLAGLGYAAKRKKAAATA